MLSADSAAIPPTTATAPQAIVGNHAGVAALVFIAVMLAGGWQLIMAAQTLDRAKIPQSWNDFWQGRTTGTFEKQMDLQLPARNALIAGANAVRYRLTGGANEQVRVGRDDWLYLTDELRYYPDAQANMAARVALLQGASNMLARDGVKLVIALVPDKARVYPRHLPTGRAPLYTQSRYQDALTALHQRGVAAVDLFQPLATAAAKKDGQGEVYYRTDTHWNQHGAQVAAQAIADYVNGMPASIAPSTFTTEQNGRPQQRVGDLIRLMGLENVPNPLRPHPDWESPQVTRQTSVDAAAGLFDDSGVPVVLTGTSYSLRGNFHGYLQQALGTKVLNSAKDGAGFLQATTAYLKDEAYKTAKPKVLIWEVPERFLPAKLEGETDWLRQAGMLR